MSTQDKNISSNLILYLYTYEISILKMFISLSYIVINTSDIITSNIFGGLFITKIVLFSIELIVQDTLLQVPLKISFKKETILEKTQGVHSRG